MIYAQTISLSTRGDSEIKNITGEVQKIAAGSGCSEGVVNVFVIGSTASVSTIEFEPALVEDFRDQLESFAPRAMRTRHGDTWGDDNGYAHIRATFMGPGITVPLHKSSLVLGTWQQIIVIDHDNRPRKRDIFVQVMGE
jgi:secondary thiamine-phosphate synthase enzyme